MSVNHKKQASGSLQILTYDEADPAYVGGLDKTLGEQLQAQLPDCVIVL